MALSNSLIVDFYELTMASVYYKDGLADTPCTFSLFVRSLPPNRNYLIAAGLEDVLGWLEEFEFTEQDLSALAKLRVFDEEFLHWLGKLTFSGNVRAVREGTLIFAGEPILEIQAPLAQGQLVETFLLNQTTLQTVLATKVSRFRHAAQDKIIMDFALRRTQGIDAGMKLTRVGKIIGLNGTSNVTAGIKYGLGLSGTMAHSFVQSYESEQSAFDSYVEVFGSESVLLVDTYDPIVGIKQAIKTAKHFAKQGINIRGIRLDSGNLLALSRYAREQFDEAGLQNLAIFASGGLDERSIDNLVRIQKAPIDGFGVGCSMGVSDDAPVIDTVYKLVSLNGRPVGKTSPKKAVAPGPKQVWRSYDWSGDIITLSSEYPPSKNHYPLLDEVMVEGKRNKLADLSLDDINSYFEQQWEKVPLNIKEFNQSFHYSVTNSDSIKKLIKNNSPNRRPR